MSDMSDKDKDKEEAADKTAEEPKKKPDLDDTISRLLRRQADVDGEEGSDSTKH